jgi:two-component system sensor histidine kinase KdpD
MVTATFGLSGSGLLVAATDTIYRSSPEAKFDVGTLKATLARGELATEEEVSYVPLRIGTRTSGSIAISASTLSRETLEAIGVLIGIAIERVRAVDEVTRTRALQENERLRSALLDSVSHEFRTPLTGIKASVSTLRTLQNLDQNHRDELLAIID